jgi:hypothetical protein
MKSSRSEHLSVIRLVEQSSIPSENDGPCEVHSTIQVMIGTYVPSARPRLSPSALLLLLCRPKLENTHSEDTQKPKSKGALKTLACIAGSHVGSAATHWLPTVWVEFSPSTKKHTPKRGHPLSSSVTHTVVIVHIKVVLRARVL